MAHRHDDLDGQIHDMLKHTSRHCCQNEPAEWPVDGSADNRSSAYSGRQPEWALQCRLGVFTPDPFVGRKRVPPEVLLRDCRAFSVEVVLHDLHDRCEVNRSHAVWPVTSKDQPILAECLEEIIEVGLIN